MRIEDSSRCTSLQAGMKLANLANFKTMKTLQNRELGQLGRTWPTFFDRCRGTSKTCATLRISNRTDGSGWNLPSRRKGKNE